MSGKAVRETLAALGVIASLVFVGMELQQNTAAIRGQTRQSLNADYREWQLTVASNPDLFDAFSEDFEAGGTRSGYAMYARLRNLENVFLQVQEGLVDQSVFISYGWSGNRTYDGERFRAWWMPRRDNFHPDFVAAFEAEYDLGGAQ